MLLKALVLSLGCAAALQAQAPTAGRFKDLDSLSWRQAGPGVEMPVVDGNPQTTGDFTMAMRFKAGGIIPPHFHPAGAHHFEAGKTDALVFLTGPGPLKTTMIQK